MTTGLTITPITQREAFAFIAEHHRHPFSFWRSLAEMPPAHRLGQGAFFRTRTDHGRRNDARPSLDFYDNLDGFARASIVCNRVWSGWLP
jgi:hypothetical protein